MKKIACLISILLMIISLTSCKTKNSEDALSLYNGVVHNSNYANSNDLWYFHSEPAYDEEGNVWGFELYMSSKTEINTKKIPSPPTVFDRSINRVFATNDYLYFISDQVTLTRIGRIDLNDYSTDIIYEESTGMEKVVFGLAFSYERSEKERGLNPYYILSNDKDVFFTAHDKGVFKIMPDKTAKNIIADDIRYDIAYDGNYIFYIASDGILKQYEIKSGETTILSDMTVTPYTLKVTKEDITFESDGEKVTLSR